MTAKKFIVQHVGYPIGGRPIRLEEWKEYSRHTSIRAAWRAIFKATAHLQYGTWDDHYRIIVPDGEIVTDRYHPRYGAWDLIAPKVK